MILLMCLPLGSLHLDRSLVHRRDRLEPERASPTVRRCVSIRSHSLLVNAHETT